MLNPRPILLPFWLAVGLCTSCDAARQGANPEVPLWENRPGMALTLVSQSQLTFEGRNFDEAYEHGRPTLDPSMRRVFVGSSDHGLYALRAHDGTVLWRFETMGAVQCEPLYDPSDDSVYFGSNDGALYKVSAQNGKLQWRFMSASEVQRKPVLHQGKLYFSNANDTLVALDPKTGQMIWNYHRAPVGGMSVAGYAGPAVLDNRVFVAFSDGHVMAFDANDGSSLWQPVDLAAELEQIQGYQVPKYFDADTTPLTFRISTGPVVAVATYAGGLYVLDAETGAQAWSNDRVVGVTDLMMWTQPAHPPRDGGPTIPARRLLLASTGTSGLWALDPEDGQEVWRLALPAGGVSAPASIAGAIMVTTTRYGIFLISPLNGKVIDGIDLGMTFSMAPAAYGNRAFVLSDGGAWLSLHVSPPLRSGG
ncbi:MAG TPA: PQQ-binding-like beta-propeller repeat protein [Polyangiaceae bacterium]|nr:MAG: Serine/threonine-protein kinase AfsK [Deltaproteobacteria bacterium ADurb.Bin207]HNZ23230.1 PQQ-binding-like beta-propeller repeat protein [Polyangiaceae bacterium]HOD24663.1 PQQ-binding-like beta-propeller repeat protein [Polyangiaceae bacterium]HOE50930.1 PQQ-binding-like beta-propeller repeat protein [Polyangiaceae bacterium]HOH00788.1 PQQ-binding-like beta-propeller repeat protein [Polyangiaceae bacterium]